MTALGEQLVETGQVRASDIARAEEVAARTGARLPVTLARLGLVSETQLADAFGRMTGLPLLSAAELTGAPDSRDGFNLRFLARHAVLPLGFDDGRLILAMGDPFDEEAKAAMTFASGHPIAARIATFSDIEDAVGFGGADDDALADLAGGLEGGADADADRLIEDGSDAPVIRLVNRLVADAVKRQASDIHLEPMARHLAVRYRIDGRLIEVEQLADRLAAPIASRIKVMAGLDIAEARLPQDGRMRAAVRGHEVDIRVATTPIAHGESIVLRLLGRSAVPLDLERLGLPAPALAALGRALERPHGIILVTGPTGSGKTTTLYAALTRLRRPEVKILTVEDPVEVLLDGVNQVQVRTDIGLGYAATLRAFLRQDPDILMVGEIRDHETAEIALRAALTGHLVLSTLHTNSALGAFTRLRDMGVEPYLTATTVIASIAQRLIRALCADCRAARAPSRDEVATFEAAGIAPPAALFDPQGCTACQQTGYRGRLPLIEVVEVDDALRDRIRDGSVDGATPERPGTGTLLGHGLALVAGGRTSLDEVRRVLAIA